MAAADLTAARLRELLHYDPETGVFTWRETGPGRHTSRAGRAGATASIGYIVIRVGGTLLYAHRLAWLYVTGEWPAVTIDHIDGDKGNNRFSNLRDVQHRVNAANHHKAQGSAGLLGAVKNSRQPNWRAIITVGGKQKHIGTFDSPEAAHEAYMAERRKG